MTTKTLTTEAEFLAAEKEIPLLQAVRDGLPKGSLGSAENNAVEALSDKIWGLEQGDRYFSASHHRSRDG
jgi:hypothetical protein